MTPEQLNRALNRIRDECVLVQYDDPHKEVFLYCPHPGHWWVSLMTQKSI